MKHKIKADSTGPGVFANERSATLVVNGEAYTLIVPQEYIQGDYLLVELVARRGDQALVDLPRETFTSGPRLMVPEHQLLQA